MKSDRDHESARTVEQIFEEVRIRDYPLLPSRKNCIFLFDLGLDPDKYASSISFVNVRRELNLVEVDH